MSEIEKPITSSLTGNTPASTESKRPTAAVPAATPEASGVDTQGILVGPDAMARLLNALAQSGIGVVTPEAAKSAPDGTTFINGQVVSSDVAQSVRDIFDTLL